MQSDLERLVVLQDADRVVMGIEEEVRVLEPEIAGLDETVKKLEAGHARLRVS